MDRVATNGRSLIYTVDTLNIYIYNIIYIYDIIYYIIYILLYVVLYLL